MSESRRRTHMASKRITSYTEARQNLKSLMDSVTEDRVPVIITRTTGDPVIMLAKAEYDATMETFHLLRSPRTRNACATQLPTLKRITWCTPTSSMRRSQSGSEPGRPGSHRVLPADLGRLPVLDSARPNSGTPDRAADRGVPAGSLPGGRQAGNR